MVGQAAKDWDVVTLPSPDFPVPDEDLMMAVGTGDTQALHRLIERWQGPLINFFYRSLQNVQTAEDLAQMTFIRVYRAAPRYRAEAKFSTWLFQIARRLLINEYRRQSRKPADTTDPADLQGSTSGRDPLALKEVEEAFAQALETLPENQKTALLLLKQQELSYEEIADIMGASISAVKTWIHRGRTRLKALLKDVL